MVVLNLENSEQVDGILKPFFLKKLTKILDSLPEYKKLNNALKSINNGVHYEFQYSLRWQPSNNGIYMLLKCRSFYKKTFYLSVYFNFTKIR